MECSGTFRAGTSWNWAVHQINWMHDTLQHWYGSYGWCWFRHYGQETAGASAQELQCTCPPSTVCALHPSAETCRSVCNGEAPGVKPVQEGRHPSVQCRHVQGTQQHLHARTLHGTGTHPCPCCIYVGRYQQNTGYTFIWSTKLHQLSVGAPVSSVLSMLKYCLRSALFLSKHIYTGWFKTSARNSESW